jgi:DMSO/TMAO reductase YedYZ molybdopterin-dependent catalytic subunit
VLSAGPTPYTPLSRWDLSIHDETGGRAQWTWEEFRALSREPIIVDLHCVTTW